MEYTKNKYLYGTGTGDTWHVNIDPPTRKVRTYFEETVEAVKLVGRGYIELREKDQDFPSRGALDISAARRDFGFDPKIDIDEGFEIYYDWLKNSEYWKTNL